MIPVFFGFALIISGIILGMFECGRKDSEPGTKPDPKDSVTETEARPKETIYVSYETEASSKRTDSLVLDVRDYIPDRVESPGLLGPVSQVPESGETMEKEGRP